MILTVTPNPSVDRTLIVPGFALGSVNRAQRSRSEPSGKGVNVALALRAHGVPVRAILAAGGPTGDRLCAMLAAAGLDTVVVPIEGEIRSNISLIGTDGTATKINEPGPQLSAAESDALLAAVTAQLLPGTAGLVGAGSLPAAMAPSWYGRIVECGRQRGVFVAIDSSGAALAESLPAEPDLIKPNVAELAALTGADLRTLGDVVDAAHALRARGARAVLASLGGDGAVLVDRDGALYGQAPVDIVVNTVGAGDAMLAGYVGAAVGARRDRAEALATALRWGAAAVAHEGTLFAPPDTATVAARVSSDIDTGYSLSEGAPPSRKGFDQ